MLGGNLGGGGEFSLSPDETNKFKSEFTSLPSANGKINSDTARTFFMRSGLPPQVLGRIWTLSDDDKDNQLTVQEFCVAMKLVRMALSRQNLPLSIPKR